MRLGCAVAVTLAAAGCGRLGFSARDGNDNDRDRDGPGDGDATLVSPPHTYAQTHYVKASKPHAADQLGFSVAVSGDGNTVAVAAWSEDGAAIDIDGDQADQSSVDSGAVYVFARTASVWAQQAYVKAHVNQPGAQLGFSLALSPDGSDLFAGAWRDPSSAAEAGEVYEYRRTGAVWSWYGTYGGRALAGEHYGQAIARAAGGSTLILAAPGDPSSATDLDDYAAPLTAPDAGAITVFPLVNGVPLAYLKPSDNAAGNAFGTAVAVSADGDTLVVGAPGAAGSAGEAYVFTHAGAWTQAATFPAPSGTAGDAFGTTASIAADGSMFVVGAPGEDDAAGAAYVFARDGASWTQTQRLVASNADPGDAFGFSLQLAADGSQLAISARLESSAVPGVDGNQADNNATFAGAVYTFGRAGDTWTQHEYLKASNPDPGDFFGFSVGLSADGAVLCIGAVQEASDAAGLDGDQTDNSLVQAGAAYLFE